MTARIGRQTPTQSLVLPYSKTYGPEGIETYNRAGKKAMEWQELLLCDMMAYNDDGLWTHTKYGYAVPRRNGKNEVVAMRELYGVLHGESILHTAHRTPTSHSAWERLCYLLARSGLIEGEDYKTLKQFGLEQVTMLKGEGRVNFRTRSSKGGLGEGYDLLIIDEAQEYTDDQESAQTLKFYCNEGLVPNVKRDKNNRRVFDERDIAWIKSLTCLKNCGMSIQEMKDYLALCLQGEVTIPQRKEMLAHKQEALRKTMRQIQESIDYIDWKQGFYDDVLSGKRPYESNLTPVEK